MAENYVGKVVLIESTDRKNNYYDGEYVVVEQSPANIYCIKTTTGNHDSGTTKQFALLGAQAYTVVKSWKDDAFIRRLVQDNLNVVNTQYPRQWVESCYTRMRDGAEKMLRAIGSQPITVSGPPPVSAKLNAEAELTRILAAYTRDVYTSSTRVTSNMNAKYAAQEILREFEMTRKAPTPAERIAQIEKGACKLGLLAQIEDKDFKFLVETARKAV